MVKVELKGVAKVTSKRRTYWYAWRGGPRLRGEPGSPEFITSYHEAHYPNLRLRPPAPNKGRGRLQRQVRRAFVACGPVVSSSAVYDWCYARGRRLTQRRRHSVWRLLVTMADPIRRVPPYGAWLWRLREPVGSAVGSEESCATDKPLPEKEK
jgi:hypothetical protein